MKETGQIYKVNLSYKLSDDKLVYGTYSQGFRPGGINRRSTLAPYEADYLYNYELGWKTEWADNTVRWNGAVFFETWKDFQFSFLGANSFTQILNAGQAEIKGAETEVSWATPVQGLTLTGGTAYTDAYLTEAYCGTTDAQGKPIKTCAHPQAPSGTALPVTPKLKANARARYEFELAGFDAHVQAVGVYQSEAWSDLRLEERGILGQQDAFGSVDLAAGLTRDNWRVELTIANLFDEVGDKYRYAQCTPTVCGGKTYSVPIQPRTLGLSFGQKF